MSTACRQVNDYVDRELANHRQLIHPHIIQFKEVMPAPWHWSRASVLAKPLRLYRGKDSSVESKNFPHHDCGVQVFLTPSHLAIVMEYAAGGELFDFLAHRRFLTENEAPLLLPAAHLRPRALPRRGADMS